MTKEKTNLIDQETIEEYFSNKNYMYLLPLLEQSLSEIKNVYSNIKEVELVDLVNYALDWETKDYWQILSVEWIESGLPATKSIKSKLEKIPKDKRYSQQLRHKVQKILKSLHVDHKKKKR